MENELGYLENFIYLVKCIERYFILMKLENTHPTA